MLQESIKYKKYSFSASCLTLCNMDLGVSSFFLLRVTRGRDFDWEHKI